MAELREMPQIGVKPDTLMEWGRIWHGSEGSRRTNGEVPAKRPSCFDKRQAMEFGRVFDLAFGHALARMLGVEVAMPSAASLVPAASNCVEVGPTRVIGGIRPQNYDVAYRPDIQQEVLLLLGDGRNRNARTYGKLYTRQVVDGEALLSMAKTSDVVAHVPERHTHADMKWTSLFLEDDEFRMLRDAAASDGLDRLGKLADVDVGIVTGRNSFFVVTEGTAQRLGLDGRAVDVVGRTAALKSVQFTADDLRRYGTEHRSKLINLSGQPRASFSTALDEYIRSGEEQGVDRGYKCRIRNRWFDVPSVYVPDAFLFRQIHHAPLLAANHARATSTDTIHRVRVAAGVDVDSLCASMVNSLTFAWAEVCGRSYGGGVLELEPREAERLLVPYRFSDGLDVDYIDRRLRAGDLAGAMDYGDGVLLKAGCGFSDRDITRARAAWNRLRSRRHRRRQRSQLGVG